MGFSALDDAIVDLGPVPAIFRFSTDVAYATLRNLIRTRERFANYSVRTFRSLVHDDIWAVARELLVEVPDCRVIAEAGTEILRVGENYVVQVHKTDESHRISINGTMRPLEIQGQGHLWQIGAARRNKDIWLTIGHVPNPFTHTPDAVVIGVALEDGMTEFRHIDPAADIVAKISPRADEVVRRLGGMDA